MIALSAVICAVLVRDVFGGPQAGTLGLLAAALGAISLTALVGAFTGTLVAYARVQPFIVTLALLSMRTTVRFPDAPGSVKGVRVRKNGLAKARASRANAAARRSNRIQCSMRLRFVRRGGVGSRNISDPKRWRSRVVRRMR